MDDDTSSLRKKYHELFGEGDEGASAETITEIEARLNVKFPQDMKSIASFYKGGVIGGVSHHAFELTGPGTNVIGETTRLRRTVNLPLNFVVIAEPPNSLIVLDTATIPGTPAVYWCDGHDTCNLDSKQWTTPPDTWDSYPQFFSFLLQEEQDERDESDGNRE